MKFSYFEAHQRTYAYMHSPQTNHSAGKAWGGRRSWVEGVNGGKEGSFVIFSIKTFQKGQKQNNNYND